MKIAYLSIIFIALVYADIITTVYGLSHGLQELNPFFNYDNILHSIVQKLAISYLLIILLWVSFEQAKKENVVKAQFAIKLIAFMLCVFYMGVLGNNIFFIITRG